ncbi:hypothetical protein FS749_003183 [Ceratobasidium sp. UAMH 11750]|nr:hypothetical protein FS749_003183 [Ceratobasidium sp. UAMH 11750]
MRAAQAKELAKAIRLKCSALPPIPDPEPSLALISDPSLTETTTTDDSAELQVLMHLGTSPLPRLPKISSKSKLRPMSTATGDTPRSTTEAMHHAWANNLKNKWEHRGARGRAFARPAGYSPSSACPHAHLSIWISRSPGTAPIALFAMADSCTRSPSPRGPPPNLYTMRLSPWTNNFTPPHGPRVQWLPWW